ncbi:nuclear transport factor 2 family protein [Gilvimarinus sp. 1_MG-2023]|uniref:nuclear transport factor 2 family protein n=1 Tax=Gilvimarinus sp. 1_MG-2023 TaxID=3062638 RepID=UPI0026E19724|nr:nuclear transport factor 2 family protein [Gilvimarinus sp. 1_MG-2023]MDO6745871.1 nuclear transport factor 2 family protein [Gilvimarinus sp. 1_MG-2023]
MVIVQDEKHLLIDTLKAHYQTFDKSSLADILSLYNDDICFIDPVERFDGKEDLRLYFANLAENLTSCQFDFQSVINDYCPQGESSAVLFWQMRFSHPKLNSGVATSLAGCSHLRYSDKIYYHRDYYDLGEMLYENIPLLGRLIRSIKKRLASK